MNVNLKNLLEKISTDNELRAKFKPLTLIEDQEAANAALIALAAEIGMPLTAADLEPEDEKLDLDELNVVAGGGACACTGGGAGGKSEYSPISQYGTGGDKDELCWCAIAGGGTWADVKGDGGTRCACPFVGGGSTIYSTPD